MSEKASIVDLGRLSLLSGEGGRLDTGVRIDGFELGGRDYAVPGGAPARLDVSRTTAGYALRLRFAAELSGPCMRCLEPSLTRVEVDAREVDQPGGGEQLHSPYLSGDELDLAAWARDAMALALPTRIVCRPGCPGLCPVCGLPLASAGPEHGHEPAPDPRWAKLRELKLE